jgi:hypothetical protein
LRQASGRSAAAIGGRWNRLAIDWRIDVQKRRRRPLLEDAACIFVATVETGDDIMRQHASVELGEQLVVDAERLCRVIGIDRNPRGGALSLVKAKPNTLATASTWLGTSP